MEKTLFPAAGYEFLSRPPWDIGFLHPNSGTQPSVGKPERADQSNHENRKHKLKTHSEEFGKQKHYSVKCNRLSNCEKQRIRESSEYPRCRMNCCG